MDHRAGTQAILPCRPPRASLKELGQGLLEPIEGGSSPSGKRVTMVTEPGQPAHGMTGWLRFGSLTLLPVGYCSAVEP